MNRKQMMAGFLSVLMTASLTGCQLNGKMDSQEESLLEEVEQIPEPERVMAMTFLDKETVIRSEQRFLQTESLLELSAPEGASVYYTVDGTSPSKKSARYEEPILFKQKVGDFPECMALRAKAYFADGSESEVISQTFWTAPDMHVMFKNLVVSIIGEPAEITEKPDGIFYGKNAKQHGRASERGVSVEMLQPDGSVCFAQNAGLRVFGAASRDASIKSMKLFARKSYDAQYGKFNFDGFDSIAADGEPIAKYDKLVLRNAGNDFQFAFIRDELNQRLAADAGYVDCEAVLPVVVYLNGSYYGMHWLHEALCDDLLKDKFGGKTGKYTILEGTEQIKNVPEDDEETAAAATAFNARYDAFLECDLRDEEAFQELNDFLDVEQYLQYYALNIYVNNRDWPQNNEKCYRYEAGAEEAIGEGEHSRTDGRWRFWFHDMDYCMGLYEQDETQASYNNLAQILDPNSERYSPLFAGLMQRDDCRATFISEMERLMEVLSEEHIIAKLDEMNTERFFEMKRYFAYLEERKKQDKSIWIWYQGYQQQTQMIHGFWKRRASAMKNFLEQAFHETDENME